MKKLYVIQKYIIANSAKQALKLEKFKEPDEVYIDSDFKKANPPLENESPSRIGFQAKK